MAFDINDPEDVKLLQERIEEETAGLKKKNGELIGDMKTLKLKVQDLLDKTSGVDIEKLKELQSRLANDEEARLISEGKTQEVIDRRTKLMREAHEKEIKAEQDKAAANLAFANRFRDATLMNSVREAAVKNGVEPTAVDDVIYRAKAAGFTVDDDGNPIMRDSKGDAILGKDGKSPLQPSEWVEGLREKAPHLWPKASGGGAGGGGSAAAGKKKFSEYSEKERVELYRKSPEEYERLKKAEKST